MRDSIFMVTSTENGTQFRPDMFHYLEDAREYLLACMERFGIDPSVCKYEEFTDVEGFESQCWTDSNGDKYTIQEFELR